MGPRGEAMSSVSHYQAGSSVTPWTVQEDMRWYALHTHARHERVVENRLREHGMETFLPVVQEVHRCGDRKKTVEVSLFSCYIFVRCAWNDADRTEIHRVDEPRANRSRVPTG